MFDEAIASGHEPRAVYVTERGLGALGDRTTLLGAQRLFVVDERSMARLSDVETPPGIIAVFPLELASLQDLLATGEPAIVLAGVADPGNAGTLLRSAEIFGIRHAVFAREAVEPHNPKVVRATMGAIFRMSIATVDASELIELAATHRYTIVAATHDGIALPVFTFPKRALLAIGNERHGVSGWLPRYDAGVTIPQPGGGESLNASIAGGIILYAFSQQM